MDASTRRRFRLAERVDAAARELGIDTAVIGATALAVHRFVRATGDIDLATAVDPYRDPVTACPLFVAPTPDLGQGCRETRTVPGPTSRRSPDCLGHGGTTSLARLLMEPSP
jgi:hypothetical protein